MDVGIFKEAQQAYARGDFDSALDGFIECTRSANELSPSDLSKFYHLIGNCYVKLGDPVDAADAYSYALAGSSEKRKPSLYVNLGTALLGTKEYGKALTAFTRALDYPVYTTPYKAYAGIGAAQLKLGNMTEAGAAYREAALDPANPDPAKALVNLGVCFMELGRASDAVSTYETALEFDLAPTARAKALANLGQAYLAEGRVNRALSAFEEALSDGSYQLSPMARHDYDIALTLKEKLDARMPGVLDTGFIPKIEADEPETTDVDEPSEVSGPTTMTPDASGHLPVYGEPGFDPFAPRTLDPKQLEKKEDEKAKAEEDASEDSDADASKASDSADDQDDASSEDESPEDKAPDDLGQTVAMKAAPEPEASEEKPEHNVASDGVDEGELEAALEELGISTRSARKEEPKPEAEPDFEPLWEDYKPEKKAANPATSEEPEAAEDADEGDASSADTVLIPPVSSNSDLDIPTEKNPAVHPDEGATEAFDRVDEGDSDPDKTDVIEHPVDAGAAEDDFGVSGTPFRSDTIDSGEPLVDLDATDTHMPSPENTQFFDVTEQQINEEAREDRKKARKSRGVGLKVAIVVVILAILVVGAGAAAYVLGYGYPMQEDVARGFFAATQSNGDTSQYWADDVDESSRSSQVAVLDGLTSYNVEAVTRSMAQTTVYVKGTLSEGGQVDYMLVMTRKGISWGIEYIELYFPSQDNSN